MGVFRRYSEDYRVYRLDRSDDHSGRLNDCCRDDPFHCPLGGVHIIPGTYSS
jgi:hypothetical protein